MASKRQLITFFVILVNITAKISIILQVLQLTVDFFRSECCHVVSLMGGVKPFTSRGLSFTAVLHLLPRTAILDKMLVDRGSSLVYVGRNGAASGTIKIETNRTHGGQETKLSWASSGHQSKWR